MNVLASFKHWLDSPFDQGMSAAKWFAFVGLLIAILMVWHIILAHIDPA